MSLLRSLNMWSAACIPRYANNPDYTSIINDKQYNRIQGYLDDAIAQGAQRIEINPLDEDLALT